MIDTMLTVVAMASGDAKWDLGVWSPEDVLINTQGEKVAPPKYKKGELRRYMDFDDAWRQKFQYMLGLLVGKIAEWNLHSMGFAIQDDGNIALAAPRSVNPLLIPPQPISQQLSKSTMCVT